MIYNIHRTAEDEKHIPGKKIYDYSKMVVRKPWGYEYLLFENEIMGIWILRIKKGKKTSLHCHPHKKAVMILLSKTAIVHYMNNKFNIKAMDCVNIASGAFHCTEALDHSIWLMEIEMPPIKDDLVRIEDQYGRTGKPYEGEEYMITKEVI